MSLILKLSVLVLHHLHAIIVVGTSYDRWPVQGVGKTSFTRLLRERIQSLIIYTILQAVRHTNGWIVIPSRLIVIF